jgi:hypothetical protein
MPQIQIAAFSQRLKTISLSDSQIQLGRIRKLLGTDGFLNKGNMVVIFPGI